MQLAHKSNESLKQEAIVIIIVSGVMLVLFVFLAASLVYNIYSYLVKQGRRKEFHLGFFYSLAAIITTARVIYFIMCIDYSLRDCALIDRAPLTQEEYARRANIVDQNCQFLEIILGIQQIGSMRELSTMVWSHHRRGGKTPPAKVKSKIDDIRFATVVASGTASLPLAYFNVVVISYY